jgi:hypothetical protein
MDSLDSKMLEGWLGVGLSSLACIVGGKNKKYVIK